MTAIVAQGTSDHAAEPTAMVGLTDEQIDGVAGGVVPALVVGVALFAAKYAAKQAVKKHGSAVAIGLGTSIAGSAAYDRIDGD